MNTTEKAAAPSFSPVVKAFARETAGHAHSFNKYMATPFLASFGCGVLAASIAAKHTRNANVVAAIGIAGCVAGILLATDATK